MKEGFEGSRPVLLSSPRLFESEALDGCSVDFGHEVPFGHGAVLVREGAVRYLLHVDLAAEDNAEIVLLLALGQADPAVKKWSSFQVSVLKDSG